MCEEEKYLRIFAQIFNIDLNCCSKCNRKNPLKKVSNRKSFQCGNCRYQLYPKSKTLFNKTVLPTKQILTVLKNINNPKINAKQIQRNCKIAYKSALRLYHLSIKEKISSDLIKENLFMNFNLPPSEYESYLNLTNQRRYIKKYPDKIKNIKQLATERMPDNYIRSILGGNIYDKELLDLKRTQLRLSRIIKKNK